MLAVMEIRPLRIALISEHASPVARLGSVDAGGQNIYVAEVARRLARDGHQVDVMTRRDDAALPPVLDVCPGMRVLHLPAGPARFVPKEQLLPHMPAFIRAAQPWFERGAPYDVVHANFFMSGLAGLRLRERYGVPVVMTFHALGLVRREHQGDADAFPPTRIEIERRLVREADALVAECPQDRNDLMRLYDAHPDTVSMVPCGVDPEAFAPLPRAQARCELGLADDEFVILQLGRLVPRKGVDNVVRALVHLPEGVRRRTRLLVVGGESAEPDERLTPEIARLRALAQDCGVADRVCFTGHRQRDQLRAYYAAADAFVSTPWYEPFGITPLEAMACGTPVIGSAVGGIQYTVLDGVTGHLVPPRDPVALAICLQHLHDHPALARAMGRAGIRRVRSLFTWDQVVQGLLQVYRSVRRPGETVGATVADAQAWTGPPPARRVPGEPAGLEAAPSAAAAAVRPAPRREPALLPPAASTLAASIHLRRSLPPRLRAAPRGAAVFLDKDGTLVEDVPYNTDPAKLRFTPRALPALQALAHDGYALVMVTNQGGLASGRIRPEEFERLRLALLARLSDEAGIRLHGVYVCPHAPGPDGEPLCLCRKPAAGLLRQAASAHGLDLKRSWMVGDILDDVEAGRRAGCRSVLLDVGNETEWRASPLRVPDHRCADLWEVAQLITGHAPRRAMAAPRQQDVRQPWL
jgi:D-inositol-3-phosphate glycosyltransferase